MTKEEKIKSEYEKLGLPFNENIIVDNGWLKIKPGLYSSKYDDLDLLKLTNHVHSIRPKTLKGIENNNGWTKLESEKDLPERNDEQEYYWIHEGSIHEMRLDPCHYEKPSVILNHYTHWRKKEEIPYPVF